MLADGWRYQCPAVVRMGFQTRLLELLYIHRPVNLVVFKSSPHVLEPASVGDRAAKERTAKLASLAVYTAGR